MPEITQRKLAGSIQRVIPEDNLYLESFPVQGYIVLYRTNTAFRIYANTAGIDDLIAALEVAKKELDDYAAQNPL